MSPGSAPAGTLTLVAPDGIGEVAPGTDLAALVATAVDLEDGDVVVVTSKVVSKAEGRLVAADRDAAVVDETVRVVARRGPVTIVENRLGLVMAAAGVDGSNVPVGSVALLPVDPDASARRLREAWHDRIGSNVAVIVSDTAGRAWRLGQTDIAIGVAGLAPLDSFAGRVDAHGNELAVTEPAVADEVAGAAELVAGKLAGRPVVLVRGLAARVLPPGQHGPGARAIQRPRELDLFALGARDAVVAAAAGDDATAFGPPATAEELGAALTRCGISWRTTGDGITADADRPVVQVLAFAHGWAAEPAGDGLVLSIR